MDQTCTEEPVFKSAPDGNSSRPLRAAGRSWFVWLRPPGEESPDLSRLALVGTRRAHTMGRCVFVLPGDGEAYSWCRRSGRAALLYGHLLNREELQNRLGAPVAPASSDAELLLAAYELWGPKATQELEGAFAAVIWDQPNDFLLGMRDAIGLVPVYYAGVGAGLVLSSDMRAVLAHPDVPHQVDRLVVAEHLLWRHVSVEETFFTRVRRLLGGHSLHARGKDLSVHRYWDPLPPGQPIDWISAAELAGFPELMKRTVASYLRLGPSAISLSAGVDSVSIAAFAVEVAEECGWSRPHALAVHFDDPTCDESEGQVAVAQALEMPFRLLSFADCLGGRPLVEAALELSPSYPSPLINIWEPLYIHLTQVARTLGIRSILTGLGGDEWLTVSPFLAADLIRAGDLRGVWGLYRTYLRSYPISAAQLARDVFWGAGLKPVLADVASRHVPGWAARRHRRREVLLPDWIAPDPALRSQLRERLSPPPPAPAGDSAYIRQIRPMLRNPLLNMQLEEVHSRSQARGVQYFHPYWSRPVVELMIRTPPHLLHEGGRSKGLARRMLAERFPQLDLARRKKLYGIDFFKGLIASEWPAIWRRWSADSALARAGVIDPARLGPAMAVRSLQRAGDVAIWLSTEAWVRARA